MPDKTKDSSEIELTLQNPLEKLLVRIEKQKQVRQAERETLKKEREIKQLKIGLIRSIFSVYRFLRVELEMEPGKLTLEEFEAVEAELKKTAETKAKPTRSWLFRVKHTPLSWEWNFYLERGYFSSRNNPFQKLTRNEIYCDYLNSFINNESSNTEDLLTHCERKEKDGQHPIGDYTPTNLRQLYEQLVEKRIKNI